MSSVGALARGLVAACGVFAAVAHAAPPPGFTRTQIAGGLVQGTALAMAPDGRIFVAERAGRIRMIENGVLLATPVLQLAANTDGERGLVGLALDPSFASSGYLYAFYTTTQPRNRVSRFTVVGNVAQPATEFVVWENPVNATLYHQGGGIAFGPDGNLYIGTGDQFSADNAQDLANEHGKLLRVTPTGAVPPGNPFVSLPGARPKIWAYGLRNPFRLHFDAPTGNLWIGNVGGNTLQSYEEVNLAAVGANYGWPDQEGPACYVSSCAGISYPIYWYAHNVPGSNGQASVTLGPVYRGSVFPSEYVGNLFVADFSNRWMRRLQLGPGPSVIASPYFDTAPDTGSVVDVKEGVDGALYYVTIGLDPVGEPDPNSPSAVYRIAFTATGNQAPVSVAGATPSSGVEPLPVQFSSAGSTDPDAGPLPLSFAWTFGDGASSTLANPSRTYTQPGVYNAQLTVSDGVASGVASLPIRVGRPPVLTLLEPPAGTQYRAGDLIEFSASAVDPDDGSLAPAAFTWTVLLRHAEHVHPFLGPIAGVASGSFTIPDSGHSPENTSYQVSVRVVDSDGLDAVAAREVEPLIASIAFDTSPSGIPFFLDGEPLLTPVAYASNPGFRHQVEAQQTYVLNGLGYAFASWSDAGAREHEYTAPEAGGSLLASYVLAPDADGDGLLEAVDNCPTVYNPAQTDTGGFASAGPDGVGDDCQCAEVSGDGHVSVLDAVWMSRVLSGFAEDLPFPARCPASLGAACDEPNRLVLREGLAGLRAPGPSGCLLP